MDYSIGCSRPTVFSVGHAKCLRYWQPAKVHKAAELYCIIPADSAKTSSCYVICCRRPLDAQRQLCDDAHGDGSSGGAAS